MKRGLRFLARLYPSRWRRRYGTEFDALLNDVTLTPRDGFDILMGALRMHVTRWGFSGFLLAGSLAGLLVTGVFSTATPAHYVSRAVIEIRPANHSALRTVEELKGDIFSREALDLLIDQHNLYPGERSRLSRDEIINRMRDAIITRLVTTRASGTEDTATFNVAFDYPDPKIAQEVSTELASAFIEHNLDLARRQNDAGATFRVLDPPSLPLKLVSPSRAEFAAGGLTGGMLVGLTTALVLRSRRSTRPDVRPS